MSRADRIAKKKARRGIRKQAVDILIKCPTGCGEMIDKMLPVSAFAQVAAEAGETLPELPEGTLVARCGRCEHVVYATPKGERASLGASVLAVFARLWALLGGGR